MMQQTFISYSTKDEATAIQIYDGLKARGINCWIACIGLQLCPGTAWQSEIINALEDSSVMLLIFSSNVNESEQILKEISVADDNGIVIIPLKIDNAPFTGGYNFELKNRQHIQLYDDIDKRLDEIADTIKYLTAKIDKFVNAVRENYSENKGIANDLERDYLLGEGTKMGLKRKEAEKIIAHVFGSSNNQESEEEYLNLLDKVLDDRVVSAIEKKLLEQKAKNLGISDFRAQELLTQAKEKLGIFDAPITDIVKNNSKPTIEDTKPSIKTSANSAIEEFAFNAPDEENTTVAEGDIRDQVRLDFWSQALDALKGSKTNLYDKNRPVKRYNMSAYSDVKGVGFELYYLITGVRIGLYIYGGETKENKSIFDLLYKNKLVIEQLFGHSLIWERMDQKIASAVSYSQEFDCLNRDNWPTIIKWLVDTLIKFENAFKAPLNELKGVLSLQNSDDSILTANAQILFDPDLDTTLTDNNTANNTLTEESTKDSESIFDNAKDKNKISFEAAFDKLKEDYESDPEIKFKLKTEGNDFTIIGFTSTSIQFKKGNGSSGHTLSIKTLSDLYYDKGKINISEGVGIYYPSILDKLRLYGLNESTEVQKLRIEDFIDIPAENTTIDKTRSPQTKNQLTISGKMHVGTLKKQFKSLFGLTLRIYDGRSLADEKATIANIRKVDNKTGEYSPGNNTKLVTIENKMMEVFGLKIQIYGSDDRYSCNRELTLKQAKIEDDKKIERKELKNIKAKDTKD